MRNQQSNVPDGQLPHLIHKQPRTDLLLADLHSRTESLMADLTSGYLNAIGRLNLLGDPVQHAILMHVGDCP